MNKSLFETLIIKKKFIFKKNIKFLRITLLVSAARDIAIVSPVEGTTRDALETRIEIASCPVTLIDTAGVRETSDYVEAEGVARTKLRFLSFLY